MARTLLAFLMTLGVSFALTNPGIAQRDAAAGYSMRPVPVMSPKAGTYNAPAAAVIKDLRTGNVTRMNLEHPDEIYSAPQPDEPPTNDLGISYPIDPADPRIALVLFSSDGANYRCVGAAIGRRLILTAGHCVVSEQTGQFASNVSVIPGYDSQSGTNTPIAAARLISFSGWVDGRDNAHDIGIIELVADLPNTVVPYTVSAFGPACPAAPVLQFRKRFYSPVLSQGGKQFMMDHIYRGCHRGTLYHRQPTERGSSGSPAFSTNDPNSIIALVSAGSDLYGYDARLTRGKNCFIAVRLLGGVCY